MTIRISQSMKQTLRLTQAQRLVIKSQLIQLRFSLRDAVHQQRLEPKAQCPCGRQLTVIEILKGFTDNPADITTKCPACKTRFNAQLYTTLGLASTMYLTFYCPVQTTDNLRGFGTLDFEAIKKEFPAVFYSALVHFGTLHNAFKQIDIDYPEDPKPASWQERVEGFLGKLSDGDIAEIVGVAKKEITSLRRKQKIPAFKQRSLLEEEEG